MIVCYRRPPTNLENLVSSKRRIALKNGPPVSSFFDYRVAEGPISPRLSLTPVTEFLLTYVILQLEVVEDD
jgi:hypothetical protein